MIISENLKGIVVGAMFGILGAAVGAVFAGFFQERADRARGQYELVLAESFRERQGFVDEGMFAFGSMIKLLVTAEPETVERLAELIRKYPDCMFTRTRELKEVSTRECLPYLVGSIHIFRSEISSGKVSSEDLEDILEPIVGEMDSDGY